MNELEAIRSRHSVRRYTDRPIDEKTAAQLASYITSVNESDNVRIVPFFEEPRAFGSFFATYGTFSNVRNYLAVVGDKHDGMSAFRAGYAGEKVVLEATRLGLDTCWVGLTYSRSKIPLSLGDDEKILAVIAIGYGIDHGHSHKVKKYSKVAPGMENAPEWFHNGVESALLAPTALNQQKFRFEWLGENNVKVSTSSGPYTRIDMGIACCHFEIGAKPTVVNCIVD